MRNLAITSFLMGRSTATSPRILLLYPGFLAYVSGQSAMGTHKYFRGLFMLARVLTMMLTLEGLMTWF